MFTLPFCFVRTLRNGRNVRKVPIVRMTICLCEIPFFRPLPAITENYLLRTNMNYLNSHVIQRLGITENYSDSLGVIRIPLELLGYLK